MRRILTAFGLSILMVVTVSAQSSGPEEPDIMLPPMVLEIEDLSEESVQAALPDIWDPLVPELSIPLPEAEAISVSESVFDIELIDEMLPSGEGQDVRTSSFASEGMIGAGASNHIIGDVSLYKLGKSPRFSIHFYHEGMDGYGKRSPGEGFFFSDDAIDAEFSHTADKTDFSLSAGYSEEEDGLQDLASAYSVKHRILSGASTFTYEPRDRLSLGGGFSFESLNKLLTGTLPEEDSELILRPSVQAGLTFPGFKAGFSADYRFRSLSVDSSSSDDNWLRSALSFHWAVSSLDIGGNVGLAWDFGDAFYVPFSVDLSGAVKDILSFSVSGGFAFEEVAWSGILRENPYIALNGLLGPACGYFGRLDLRGNIGKALSITAGGDLRFLSGALVPDYSSFVNGMYTLTPEDRTLLSLSSGLSLDLGGGFSAGAGWEGDILDMIDSEAARHRLKASAGFEDLEGGYGGTLSCLFPFADEPDLPFLGIEGFFRVSEGVSFLLKGEDLLSPLLDERSGFGSYEDKGIRLSLLLKISL